MDCFGNAWISPDFYSWEKNHGEGRQVYELARKDLAARFGRTNGQYSRINPRAN